MRNANGTGSIYKLSGKRRKPYAVVVTVSMSPRKRKCLGTFRTRREAQDFLSAFNKNPYDLSGSTWKEIYDLMMEPRVLSNSTAKQYRVASERCKELWDMPIASIRLTHLQHVMGSADCKGKPLENMRTILAQTFDYAVKHELVSKNYARLLDPVKPEPVKREGKVFTQEEEKKLWENLDDITSYILIGIYSGWRANELLHLTIKDGCMYGGSKTEAGKNRLVPVHPKIQSLIDNYKPWTECYQNFGRKFNETMNRLGFDHQPKDTRHTFATRLAEAGVDDRVRKVLMGHATKDVTEKHYTHRSIQALKTDLMKI